MIDLNQVFENHWLGKVDICDPNPRICFGTGAAHKTGELAKGITQNTNALIVTDSILVKLGVINTPKKSLEEAGFNVDICKSEGVEPLIGEMRRIIEVAREKDYGVVVGIGGGSAMDRAKAVALMAETPGDIEEYLLPSEKPMKGSKPKILIPTTSGTGSESSCYIVVAVPDKEQGAVKQFIGAREVTADIAIVDPVLTLGCPPRATAGSGMDALSHSAEGFLNLRANPFSDALASKGVELASQNLRTAVHQGNDIEVRWNMSMASMIGGIVITLPWVSGPLCLGHVASESMSSRYSIPHGEACGVLLPFVYWFSLPDTYGRKKITKIAEAMGEDITDLTTKEAAEKAITATFDLLADVGLPTGLKAYNIPKIDIPCISDFVLTRAEDLYGLNDVSPRKVTLENLTEFFEKAFEGRESIGF